MAFITLLFSITGSFFLTLYMSYVGHYGLEIFVYQYLPEVYRLNVSTIAAILIISNILRTRYSDVAAVQQIKDRLNVGDLEIYLTTTLMVSSGWGSLWLINYFR